MIPFAYVNRNLAIRILNATLGRILLYLET